MNDDQIIALAREYAEEGAEEVGLPNCLQNETFGLVVTETEGVIKWLLRRFCIVEKSKVEQMYKEAVDGKCEIEKMQPQNTYAKNSILMKVGMNAGCAYTLKSLFPGIGKEVEG